VAAPPGVALMAAGLWQRLARAFGRGTDGVAEAERILLEADFGVAATDELIEGLKAATDREAYLELTVAALLADPAATPAGALARAAEPPTVILVYGVNGVGKTTTIAKLGARLEREGRRILLAAADTFRAGAVEQLRHWAERLDVPCVGGSSDGRGDPAAVAFDAIDAATTRGVDVLIVDTAGRLHTSEGLMEELRKVARVIAKRLPGAPHETLLVLDGTIGQNAVQQAKTFAEAVPVTGLVVTKLDGTARGGVVVAVHEAIDVPVKFLGMGEGADDLEPFEAREFARAMLSEE
jgi:fused signal recognition particle receptor